MDLADDSYRVELTDVLRPCRNKKPTVLVDVTTSKAPVLRTDSVAIPSRGVQVRDRAILL